MPQASLTIGVRPARGGTHAATQSSHSGQLLEPHSSHTSPTAQVSSLHATPPAPWLLGAPGVAVAAPHAPIATPPTTALTTATTELYRQAAREVLELVRPRRVPFGAHSATAADRDYLRDLLGTGLDRQLDAGRARVTAALGTIWQRADAAARAIGQLVGADVAGDVARVAADQTQLALARAFDRARAYQRGVLDGGALDTFFRTDLPRLELSDDAVFHALLRGAPDLDRELGEQGAGADV